MSAGVPREIVQRMLEAYKAGSWRKWSFNDDRFALLAIIIKQDGRWSAINDALFNKESWETKASKRTWTLLNSLEELSLLYIERSSQGQIAKFHVFSQFRFELQEKFPYLFNEPVSQVVPSHKIFPLSKNHQKISSEQADYIGVVTLDNGMIIPSGVAHEYHAYIKDDRLMITIRPAKSS